MGKWNTQEDRALKKLVEELGSSCNWERVSIDLFAGRHTAVQCQARWNKVRWVPLVGAWAASTENT